MIKNMCWKKIPITFSQRCNQERHNAVKADSVCSVGLWSSCNSNESSFNFVCLHFVYIFMLKLHQRKSACDMFMIINPRYPMAKSIEIDSEGHRQPSICVIRKTPHRWDTYSGYASYITVYIEFVWYIYACFHDHFTDIGYMVVLNKPSDI